MTNQENDPFLLAVRELNRQIRTAVNVLVWGPGKTALEHWYKKRLSIVDALRKANNDGFVVHTSEDIFDREPANEQERLEFGRLEQLHATAADLIFVLILAPPNDQPGVYRELDLIADERRLRDKTWIFIPDQLSYKKRFSSGSLKSFRESHIIKFPWPIIQECEHVRAFCIDKANEEYRQKLFDAVNSVAHNSQ